MNLLLDFKSISFVWRVFIITPTLSLFWNKSYWRVLTNLKSNLKNLSTMLEYVGNKIVWILIIKQLCGILIKNKLKIYRTIKTVYIVEVC